MKSILVLVGALITLSVCAWWASNGAHRGWTKTSVAIHKVDEITEIPYVEYEKRLVPGIEFPVLSIMFGGLLVGIGLWKGRRLGASERRK